MKPESFPITISENGVLVTIHKTSQTKKGRTYTSYVVYYFLQGQRKRDWYSDLDQAKAAAHDVHGTIAVLVAS
jgi:hypothetical protein